MKQLLVPKTHFVPCFFRPTVPRLPPKTSKKMLPVTFNIVADTVIEIGFPTGGNYQYDFGTIPAAAQAFENLTASPTFRNSIFSAGVYFNGLVRNNPAVNVRNAN